MILVLYNRNISNLFLYAFFRIFDIVNLCLNIGEWPLLTLLHLNHHFLNLFKLLETIGLHFFKLLLFRNQHVESSFFVAEESVFDYFVVFIFLKFNSGLSTLFPALIKGVWTKFLWRRERLLDLLILQNCWYCFYRLFFLGHIYNLIILILLHRFRTHT